MSRPRLGIDLGKTGNEVSATRESEEYGEGLTFACFKIPIEHVSLCGVEGSMEDGDCDSIIFYESVRRCFPEDEQIEDMLTDILRGLAYPRLGRFIHGRNSGASEKLRVQRSSGRFDSRILRSEGMKPRCVRWRRGEGGKVVIVKRGESVRWTSREERTSACAVRVPRLISRFDFIVLPLFGSLSAPYDNSLTH